VRAALGPFAAAALALLLLAAPAQAAPSLRAVGDFDTPVAATAPPRDPARLVVVELGGKLRLVKDGAVQAEPFLDLTAITLAGGERGLLSVAFAPDYPMTGRFYVYLTARSPEGEIQVREYRRADADHGDPASGRLVLAIPHPAGNHNGGQLQFGPDGLLWIATGDGGGGNDPDGNAQNTTSLLGKLLRIDPRASGDRAYTVPADNPFGNEVWAYGLRNPWRFSFDRGTGDLTIGDVGQNAHEEVDFATRASGLGRGANYGWPCREGRFDNAAVSCTAPGAVDPVIDQPQADGWCAITGGYVVRDPGLPSLAGRYLYGDFCRSELRSAALPDAAGDAPTGLSVDQLSALAEDACGRIYTLSLTGRVSQVVDGTASTCAFPPDGSGPYIPVPGADRTPCRLSVHSTGLRHVSRRRVLPLRVRASEACRITATARIRGVARFGTVRRSLPAARRVTVRLRLSRSAATRLRRALARRFSVRLQLEVRGVDAAGNARVVKRALTLRR
jgi:glucose/arabinose dehydrogenase